MNVNELQKWFDRQEKWLKYGAQILVSKSDVDDSELNKIVQICIEKEKIEDPVFNVSLLLHENDSSSIHLSSLECINGVNALSSECVLSLGKKNLCIIYGPNGSGKSSYVRLLRNICNSRLKTPILGNIYNKEKIEPTAIVKYTLNEIPKEEVWKNNEFISDLQLVDIYDANFNNAFLQTSSQITYEPFVLAFFSRLISLSNKIANCIDVLEKKLACNLPQIPQNLQTTKLYTWYKSLNKSNEKEIEEKICFSEKDDEVLKQLKIRVLQEDPAKKASEIRKIILKIDELKLKIESYNQIFSKEFSSKLQTLKNDCMEKENASKKFASSLKENCKLEGLGESCWKDLWNAAKSYSERFAYPKQSFPYMGEEARCVLCHQKLSPETIKRFRSFDEYIKGELEKNLKTVVDAFNSFKKNIPNIETEEQWGNLCQLAKIEDKVINDKLLSLLKNYTSKRKILLDDGIITDDEDVSEILEYFKNLKKSLDKSAKTFEEDAKNTDKKKLQEELNELELKKLLSENKNLIKNEFARLKQIEFLEKCKKTANTRELTIKKSELSEELITREFVDRFNAQLKKLGSRVDVKMQKESAVKGKISYKIVLTDSSEAPKLILSDGEYRIISLAAFIADVLGHEGSCPFIFDDPITSLDDDYESSVVKNLCDMSKTRQVIVFTHRISLLKDLEAEAEKINSPSETIYISGRDPKKKGVPVEMPMNVSSVLKTANTIANEKILDIKKTDINSPDYDSKIHYICQQIRILVEKSVEDYLLNNVVVRFRREIQTKNKIDKLSKIENEDCLFIDKMMTKYSYYDHPQPDESPLQEFSIEDIENDMKEFIEWLKKLKERNK
jgi:ABC-type cobalamin/Fe3+-siderophores transport system ATPase subunit